MSDSKVYRTALVVNEGPEVELVQVVRTTLLRRGKGTSDDPVRRVVQYWSTDGELLAEVDKP